MGEEEKKIELTLFMGNGNTISFSIISNFFFFGRESSSSEVKPRGALPVKEIRGCADYIGGYRNRTGKSVEMGIFLQRNL